MKSNSGQASTLEPHDSSPFSTLQLMRVTASEATSLLSACSFKDLVGTKKSVAKIHHTHFFRPSPPTHPPTHPPSSCPPEPPSEVLPALALRSSCSSGSAPGSDRDLLISTVSVEIGSQWRKVFLGQSRKAGGETAERSASLGEGQECDVRQMCPQKVSKIFGLQESPGQVLLEQSHSTPMLPNSKY